MGKVDDQLLVNSGIVAIQVESCGSVDLDISKSDIDNPFVIIEVPVAELSQPSAVFVR